NEVLKGIDLSIEKGQVTVIIGPSGSGKTTLLRCINLLEIPTEGTLRIGDSALSFREGSEPGRGDILAFRRKTGMVFQSYNLFPHMTALQNVMEAQVIVQKKSRAEAKARSLELLGKVGLAAKADSYPHQLRLVGEVLKVIKELAVEGMTMAIVTHEMKFASQVADRIVFMDEGIIMEQGSPNEVLNHPAQERTRQFLSLLSEPV
ncbi:hypothetical protein BGX30_006297, partial [Mortierella sp. GBA39]